MIGFRSLTGKTRKVAFLLGSTALWLLYSCGHQDQGDTSTSIQLTLQSSRLESYDSTQILVFAPDLDTLQYPWTGTQVQGLLAGIPAGFDRTIQVSIWKNGVLALTGESTTDLVAGNTENLSIHLRALWGNVEVKIPVGIHYSSGIRSGSLVLKSDGFLDTIHLTGADPEMIFSSPWIPLDKEYQLQMHLWNASGDLIYQAIDTLYLSAQSPYFELKMQSLLSQLSVDLIMPVQTTLQGRVSSLESQKRAPLFWGDLALTEYMANPIVSGNDWEYLEYANTTLDTLDLSSCRVAKDRITTGVTTASSLLNCIVLPGQRVVIGRDSVEERQCSSGGFTLSNTSQSLVLHCGELLVDSLYYSLVDTVNPFPVILGKSSESSLSIYELRTAGNSWTPSEMPWKLVKGEQLFGTPGF